MKRIATTIVALAVLALVASTASAQTHDHFARQRKEALARQQAAQHHFGHQQAIGGHHGVSHYGVSGHWGGPTTRHRYYHPSHGHGVHNHVQFYSASPFGSTFGYSVPGYGYYGIGSPYYAAPHCGTGVYIHREIYLGR